MFLPQTCPGADKFNAYNNLFLLLTMSAISSKQQLVWKYITAVLVNGPLLFTL